MRGPGAVHRVSVPLCGVSKSAGIPVAACTVDSPQAQRLQKAGSARRERTISTVTEQRNPSRSTRPFACFFKRAAGSLFPCWTSGGKHSVKLAYLRRVRGTDRTHPSAPPIPRGEGAGLGGCDPERRRVASLATMPQRALLLPRSAAFPASGAETSPEAGAWAGASIREPLEGTDRRPRPLWARRLGSINRPS